jgi:hypothetical protein
MEGMKMESTMMTHFKNIAELKVPCSIEFEHGQFLITVGGLEKFYVNNEREMTKVLEAIAGVSHLFREKFIK